MGETYTAVEYLGIPVTIVLVSILGCSCISIWLARKVAAKCRNPGPVFLLLILPVAVMVLMLWWITPGFEQVGDLLIPGETVMGTTAGEIKAILPGARGSLHLRNGRIVTGRHLLIGGEEYYVLSDDLPKEGMVITLSYAHSGNGNVILSWQETTAEEAEQIRAEAPALEATPGEKPTKTVSPGQKLLGVWLSRIGLAGFLSCLGVTALFQEKITVYLFIKDAKTINEIRFHFRSLLLWIPPVVCVCMMAVGSGVSSGERHVLLVPVLACGVMGAFIAADASTSLKLEGQKLTIRRLGRQECYRASDIRGMTWRRHRGMIGRSLVLVMQDGRSYWFNMDTFTGVQNMYNLLNREINKVT